jgi:hypothetical protein
MPFVMIENHPEDYHKDNHGYYNSIPQLIGHFILLQQLDLLAKMDQVEFDRCKK